MLLKRIVCIVTGLTALSVSAQNPISPQGVYIADPTARVDSDGRLYIYGSLDESPYWLLLSWLKFYARTK